MKKVLGIMTGLLGILFVITGVITKAKKTFSISVIGGVDGPTSVFVAGKVGSDISLGLITAGVILIVVVVACLLKKQRK